MNRGGGRSDDEKRGHRLLRVLLILLALAVIGIAAAKAYTKLTPRSFPMGTLTGTLEAVGGPSDIGPRAIGGTITATTSNRGVLAVSVGSSGRFTVQAVVGTYTVSGRSPQYEGGRGTCHAKGRVTVTKDTTSVVTVDCQVK